MVDATYAILFWNKKIIDNCAGNVLILFHLGVRHIIGAVTAMHDAIALANLLYAMPTKTSSDITKIFEEYHKERYPAVMESYNNSKQLAKIFDTGIEGTIVNYLTTHMPTWLWRQVVR